MSGMKFALFALATVAVARADEDYAEWKENKVDRELTTRKVALYEGVTVDLDECFDQVEDTMGASIVSYHNDTKVCALYGSFNISDEEVTVNSSGFSLYFESDDGVHDEGITTVGIILTCILVPLFLICLIVLGCICQVDETDINSQMVRLEEAELHKEEAVSEAWEKKSQEAEQEAEMETKEAAPVPEAAQ